MGTRLTFDVTDRETSCLVKLAGVIDEDNDLIEILPKITRPVVVVHTADVERINSCGVRDWVNWLGEIEKKNCKCFFIECSPTIMSQVNLVNNFLRSGEIISFYAPYFCSRCDSDQMLLIDVDQALQSLPLKAPTCRCHQCDHAMEFDDIESSYFGFLASVQQRGRDRAGIDAIKRAYSESDRKLRTRSVSMPGPPAPTTPSSNSFPSSPTIPSRDPLQSLLTSISQTGAPLSQVQGSAQPKGGGTSYILYLIIGLLVVAIGLLSVVVIRFI